MNWKSIIITSVITLIITVLSGIAVNWYTKNNIDNELQGKLFYKVVDISEFKSDSTEISLITLEIFHEDKKKYDSIDFSIGFGKNAKILDVTSKNSRTSKAYAPNLTGKNKVSYNYPSLFPEEKIKINIVVNGFDGKFKVDLESKEIVGNLYVPNQETEINYKAQLVKIIVLSCIILILLFLIYKRFNLSSRNLNNTAFLFLHSKDFEFSKKLLYNQIEASGATAFEFANLASSEYLINSDLAKANSLLQMSTYIAKTDRSKFVIELNKFIIFSKEKDYLKVKESIENCIKYDRREFSNYLDFSLLIKEICDKDSTILNLVTQLNK